MRHREGRGEPLDPFSRVMMDDEEIVGSGQLPILCENEFLFWEYGAYWYNVKEDASNYDYFC